MTRHRFRFELGALGPVVPADLEAAAERALPKGAPLRIGVFGRVEGVRDGRPIGTQAVDLESAGLNAAEASAALAKALAELGISAQVPDPETV